MSKNKEAKRHKDKAHYQNIKKTTYTEFTKAQ